MTAKIPKIQSVAPRDGHILVVTFDKAVRKYYDVRRVLNRDTFAPLRNPCMFNHVSVEPGGYAVSWGSDIDISEHELWQNGVTEPPTGGQDGQPG